MLDGIAPFPILLMTIVAVVVSFVLILENQNAEQHQLAQQEQTKKHALMTHWKEKMENDQV